MGIKEVLLKRAWLIFTIVLSLITGIVIVYSLKSEPTFSNVLASLGLSLAWLINMFWGVFKEARQNEQVQKQEQIRQEEFLVNDLRKWTYKIANIGYSEGHIVGPNSHKDPVLTYFDEVVKILENCNIYSFYEEGKTTSDRLITETKRSLETFHKLVDTATEKIPLKKSYKIGTLSEPYMSIHRIRETIYDDVCGQPMNLKLYPDLAIKNDSMRFLNDGEVTLAFGKVKVLKRIKSVIENLIEDENVRKHIDIYNKAKRKLDSGDIFEEFNRRLNKLIADWERFHEFARAR